MNRRNFIFSAIALQPVAALVAQRLSAQAPAAPEPVLVKESDPMPKSLNYCENADKGKSKICPTRKEKERAKQYCDGCQFYTAAVKGKDKVGKCQILQNNLVKAKGWCNSFVQKA